MTIKDYKKARDSLTFRDEVVSEDLDESDEEQIEEDESSDLRSEFE
jgi:hypothetical protein